LSHALLFSRARSAALVVKTRRSKTGSAGGAAQWRVAGS